MLKTKKTVLKMTVQALAFAGLGLGMSAVANAQTSAAQVVNAEITTGLGLSITTMATSPWILAASGTTPNQLTLNALANVGYVVRCNSDAGSKPLAQQNNLFEYNTTTGTYVTTGPRVISADLMVQAQGGPGFQAVSSDPAGVGIPGATGQTPAPSAGRSHVVQLSQQTDFGDAALASPSTYRVELTFTILAGSV